MLLLLILTLLADSEQDVRDFVLEFAQTWTHAEEPAEIASYYGVEATHVNPQGEWVRGRAALIPYFEPLVAGRSRDFDALFDIESVRFVAEDVALVDGTIEIRGMRGRDGSIVARLNERFAFVLRRSASQWEIAASRVMFPAD